MALACFFRQCDKIDHVRLALHEAVVLGATHGIRKEFDRFASALLAQLDREEDVFVDSYEPGRAPSDAAVLGDLAAERFALRHQMLGVNHLLGSERDPEDVAAAIPGLLADVDAALLDHWNRCERWLLSGPSRIRPVTRKAA